MRFSKHIFAAGISALALTACNNSGENSQNKVHENDTVNTTEAKMETVYSCSPEKLLTLDDYTDTAPAASEDYAAYHTENGKRDEVTTTESGLQYVIAQDGLKNGASPEGGQVVTVHYHGYFPDGSVFDSSYERNETIDFPANRVIKGWIESLHGMRVCEARTLYIPGDLAYGPQGRPGIPPNATLLFNVQLIAVKQ